MEAVSISAEGPIIRTTVQTIMSKRPSLNCLIIFVLSIIHLVTSEGSDLAPWEGDVAVRHSRGHAGGPVHIAPIPYNAY